MNNIVYDPLADHLANLELLGVPLAYWVAILFTIIPSGLFVLVVRHFVKTGKISDQ